MGVGVSGLGGACRVVVVQKSMHRPFFSQSP